jgi:archaetidylinositol phosphate synthase
VSCHRAPHSNKPAIPHQTAERLPAWANSDHLTIPGFASLVAADARYAIARWHAPALLWVIPLLALNWLGDSLDGTLARVRNRQRPRYGFYVDHILDAIGTFFLLTGLAFSGYMTLAVACAFPIAYLLLSIGIW